MKRLVIAWLLIPMYAALLQGQELCVGNHWTEKQGKEHLDSIRGMIRSSHQWDRREKAIRKQILEGTGLAGLKRSAKAPAVKTGAVHEMDGYRVTNLAIESEPGSWITGNLYEPTGQTGPFAGILCPHGHWSDWSDYGRYRHDMQKRCAVFCRMGAVVFAYDMVGYGDNKQASHEDPLALQLQTRNSMRVVDYLVNRKDVDRKRIAVTGASGGGTQSFILAAVDDRVAVSVPVVQVSAHFFGGCVCESGMPIHKTSKMQINNVEIAASIAPRPLLLVSDGADWTRNTEKVEYPFARYIYGLYGKENLVENAHFANGQHDYGFSKRQAVYRFLAKHLALKADPVLWEEKDIKLLAVDDLRNK